MDTTSTAVTRTKKKTKKNPPFDPPISPPLHSESHPTSHYGKNAMVSFMAQKTADNVLLGEPKFLWDILRAERELRICKFLEYQINNVVKYN